MRTHGTVQENLYAYLHAELSAPDRLAIEKHLRSCARCGKELESMRETMDLVGLKPPKPSQHRNELYWQLFAEKVERRIQSESTEVESPALVGRLVDFLTENQKPFSFGFISALSLGLLALAVWGLWIKAPTPDQIASNSSSVGAIGSHANVEETAMEVRAENYLEQSKTLLIGIMNTDTKSIVGSKSSLDRQRAISKTLVRESQEISSGLTDPSQQRLRELVGDLGLILIQIANLESKQSVQGVEIVKGGVERNGILFKINVEEIQRATRRSRTKGTEKQSTI